MPVARTRVGNISDIRAGKPPKYIDLSTLNQNSTLANMMSVGWLDSMKKAGQTVRKNSTPAQIMRRVRPIRSDKIPTNGVNSINTV